MSTELDTEVRLALYGIIADTGKVPGSFAVAQKTGLNERDVRDAFLRLQDEHLLFLEPKDPTHVRMAPPFSGVPTAFPVEAKGKRFYANCVWDAYGIPAALHCDAVCLASDGHTSERLTLEVRDGQAVSKPYVAHFAVPAAHWWDNIVFT